MVLGALVASVARALAAPLDVFVVRKLGVPGHEELRDGRHGLGFPEDRIDAVAALGRCGPLSER